MKKYLILALLLSFTAGCSEYPIAAPDKTTVKVTMSNAVTEPNTMGDKPYDFCAARYVGFSTELENDRGAAMAATESVGEMTISAKVNADARRVWCYSPGAINVKQTFTVDSLLYKTTAGTIDDLAKILYCSNTGTIENGAANVKLYPLTAGLVIKVIDSDGRTSGEEIKSITIASDKTIAADVTVNLADASIASLTNPCSRIVIDSTPAEGIFAVDSAQFGLSILPCDFTGTITVYGTKFRAELTFDTPLYLQAGYVKTLVFDVATSTFRAFPRRIGILGDSISTFQNYIPSGYSYYYPRSGSDVTTYDKTYWGNLMGKDYWDCELDCNSSWSGGCVAPGSTRGAADFTARCKDFTAPDVVIIHGGTNDCQSGCAVALGDFDYDTPVGQMNTNARFRDAYIACIKIMQERYPGVQIICIVGPRIDGEYGNSVAEIAKHFGLPAVDLRSDPSVTPYGELHPNAAGHRYMADRIFEETLYLFK